jgi:hypothetical protein
MAVMMPNATAKNLVISGIRPRAHATTSPVQRGRTPPWFASDVAQCRRGSVQLPDYRRHCFGRHPLALDVGWVFGFEVGNSFVGLGHFFAGIGDLHAGQLHGGPALHPQSNASTPLRAAEVVSSIAWASWPGIPSRLDGHRVNNKPNPTMTISSSSTTRKRCRRSLCAIAAPVSRDVCRPDGRGYLATVVRRQPPSGQRHEPWPDLVHRPLVRIAGRHLTIRIGHGSPCAIDVAVEFLEFRIQLDGLELFLPIRRGRLQRHVKCRLGGGFFIRNRFAGGGALLLDGIGDGDIVWKLFAVLHDGGIPQAWSQKTAATS